MNFLSTIPEDGETNGIDIDALSKLAGSASEIGFGVVELAGLLDRIDATKETQLATMQQLERLASQIVDANTSVRGGIKAVSDACEHANERVERSVADLQRSGERTREIAAWVEDVGGKMADVSSKLDSVQDNNLEIAAIARQVNILAINAKIEAARAGQYGRGFSVVADAINDLSQQTTRAAQGISEAIDALSEMLVSLRNESGQVSQAAGTVLSEAAKTDNTLSEISRGVRRSAESARDVSAEADRVRDTVAGFAPAFQHIVESTRITSEGIADSHGRVHALVDLSETIVQGSVELGAQTADARFITHVQAAARDIGTLLEDSIAEGRILERDLFSTDYREIAGSDPQQFWTPFTEVTDILLPPVQEAALDLDPAIVFCAAVDRNGYLPTHNRKFSQPQRADPVWNSANCRNRRIFDDRVGLKAGKSKAPFLMQTYRRDMGGGEFVMMKDLSAPIFVGRRHWGGLRLAYKA